MKHLMPFLLALCFLPLQAQRRQPSSSDREMLDKAIDYFASQKYHEALLLFEKLDERFKLNPRYLAYMGYCYYFDWDYASAVSYFEKALPQLQALSPHELSVYYYSLAESRFELSQYDACVEAYEQHLVRCYPDERAMPSIASALSISSATTNRWHGSISPPHKRATATSSPSGNNASSSCSTC